MSGSHNDTCNSFQNQNIPDYKNYITQNAEILEQLFNDYKNKTTEKLNVKQFLVQLKESDYSHGCKFIITKLEHRKDQDLSLEEFKEIFEFSLTEDSKLLDENLETIFDMIDSLGNIIIYVYVCYVYILNVYNLIYHFYNYVLFLDY